MKALENRTTDSKREMDILDALQDIRARNARNERVGSNAVDLLARITVEEIETEGDQQRKQEEAEDDELVRQVFSKVPLAAGGASTSASQQSASGTAVPQITVKRKADGAEPDVLALLPESTKTLISSKASLLAPPAKKMKKDTKAFGIKIVKGKAKVPS